MPPGLSFDTSYETELTPGVTSKSSCVECAAKLSSVLVQECEPSRGYEPVHIENYLLFEGADEFQP